LLLSLSVAGVSLGLAMGLAAVDSKELAANCFPAGRTQLSLWNLYLVFCGAFRVQSWLQLLPLGRQEFFCCVWNLVLNFGIV
jgi:hypothetical protein